jgi:hypothetical protein
MATPESVRKVLLDLTNQIMHEVPPASLAEYSQNAGAAAKLAIEAAGYDLADSDLMGSMMGENPALILEAFFMLVPQAACRVLDFDDPCEVCGTVQNKHTEDECYK